MKPSHVSDAVGKPAASHTALARNTAGVQLPQHAIPDMTASTPSPEALRKRCEPAFSLPPCVLPNSRQLTNLHAGIALLSRLFERLEHDVALEELVPELRNGLAFERIAGAAPARASFAGAASAASRLRSSRRWFSTFASAPFVGAAHVQARFSPGFRPRAGTVSEVIQPVFQST